MTFSIVGRNADGSAFGVAVASKFLAVGSVVPAVSAEHGALATQAFANLAYRPDGMRLLATGRTAQETVDTLVAGDDEREQRQLGVVDRQGGSASYTGAACFDWAGGRAGEGYAAQGNILVGPQVVAAMERAWLASSSDLPLAERLFTALQAGDAEGGDRRGRQSAAVLVMRRGAGYGGLSDVEVDLRVDDAADPVSELRRLLDLHVLYFGRPDPATLLPLEGPLAEEVGRLLASLGHQGAPDDALAAWAGVENYEMRLVPGQLDPLVLDRLRAAAADRSAR